MTRDDVRRDYAPLAASYERRWQTFNLTVRQWVLGRWPEAPAPARVLDLGCGAGGFLAMLAARDPELELVGLDVTPALLALARRAVPAARLVEGDVEQPPLREGAFDVICSLNVLHHLHDPVAHVRMLARLGRPGGTAFLATFAGGRTFGMRAADAWLRLRNPAWRGMSSRQELDRALRAVPGLELREQDEVKAEAWWLQLYRLGVER